MTVPRASREALGVLAAGLAIGVGIGIATSQLPPLPPPEARLAMIRASIAYWTAWAVLAIGILRLARRYPLTGPGRFGHGVLHAIGSVIFALVHTKLWTLAVLVWRWIADGTRPDFGFWVRDFDWLTRWRVEGEVTLYFAVVGLAHALAFREEERERALATARLDAELAQARLQSAQQQVDPTFLFTTLKSIGGLMHRSVGEAEEMIERLGSLLRVSLRADPAALVPLERELAYVAHYLEIARLNAGRAIEFHAEVSDEAQSAAVPELLVLRLVESQVRRGAEAVALKATAERGGLVLEVSGDGGDAEIIERTRERLAVLHPGHAIERTQSGEVRIRLATAAGRLPA